MTAKEIAEKIADGLYAKGWRIRGSAAPFEDICEVVSSLNLTVATPPAEGSVRVRIAIALEPDSHGGHSIYVRHPQFTKQECSVGMIFNSDNSHRCYSVIDVPPVAATPVVEGTVAK